MKINNIEIKCKKIAYDGCHKIYLLESEEDEAEAKKSGYRIHPISDLNRVFDESCSLRFINNWCLTRSFVRQFEKCIIS